MMIALDSGARDAAQWLISAYHMQGCGIDPQHCRNNKNDDNNYCYYKHNDSYT